MNLFTEVPQEEARRKNVANTQEKMENAYPLKVILKVDIQKGSNWRQAH